MNLSHYSDHDTLTPHAVSQAQKVFTYEKPKGLWVSVDGHDDWAAWCASERFRDTSSQHRHAVTLADDHQVLVLDTHEKVMAFDQHWSRPDAFAGDVAPFGRQWRGIDWAAVAAEGYQGVIIAPYQWSLRMNLQWYYPWDCASGCLWDPAAIKDVTLADQPQEPTREGAKSPYRT